MAGRQPDPGAHEQEGEASEEVRISRRVSVLILGVCVGVFMLVGLVQSSRDAPTVDEAVDLSAGLVAVEYQDLRMNPEHGFLHKVLPAVLPVVFADPLVPRTEAYREGDWFDYTADLLSANDRGGRLDAVVFWYRVVPLAVGATTGLLLYALGARLIGRLGGLAAAGLWLSTPYVVGLAHLSSLDISFAFVLVLLALLIDRYRMLPSGARLAALAGGLGVALLVRHSAVVVVPVVIGAILASTWRSPRRERLVAVGTALLLPLVVVWAAHRLLDPVPVEGAPRERFEALIASAASEGPVEELTLAVPMPIEWRAGFAYLVATSDDRPAYLFGDRWTGSRWWFFPASALVKLPLTLWLASVLGLSAWLRAGRWRRQRTVWAVALPGILMAVFLVLQPLNLGLRLAVPVLALAMMLPAGIGLLPRRQALLVVSAIGAVQVSAFLVSHPTSLAWTPPPFGAGYRHVSDSSVDFGQANRSVRAEHERQPFRAASIIAPRGYDVLPGVPSVTEVALEQLVGRVAVGATVLDVLAYGELGWLRAYCPVDVIDDAVLVYRFDQPPDVTQHADRPPDRCDGSEFSRLR